MADINISTALTGLEGVVNGLQSIGASALNTASPEATKRSSEFSLSLLGIKSSIDLAKEGFSAAKSIIEGTLSVLGGSALKAADDMYVLAQQAGMSTEQFSRWKLVAEQANGSAMDIVQAQRMLALRLSDTTGVGEKTQAMLKGLGAEGKDSGDILLKLSGVFEKLPDGMTKSQVASALFGRSSSQLIAILNQGPESIQQIIAASDQLGNTWSGKTTTAANAFYDNLHLLEVASQGFGHAIADQTAPALSVLSEKFVKIVTDSGAFVAAGSLVGEVLKGIAITAIVVVSGLQQIGVGLAAVAAIAHGLVTGGFEGAGAAIQDFSEQLSILREQYVKDVATLQSASGDTSGVDKAKASYEQYIQKLLKTQQAAKDLADATKTQTELYNTFGAAQDDVNARYEEQAASIKELDDLYTAVIGPMEDFYRWTKSIDDSTQDLKMTNEEYGQYLADMSRKYYPDAIAAADRFQEGQAGFSRNWTNWLASQKNSMLDWFDVASSVYGQMSAGFGRMVSDVIVQGKNLKDALGDFFKQILANFISMVAEMAAQKLLLDIVNGSSFGGSVGSGALQGVTQAGVSSALSSGGANAITSSQAELTASYYGGSAGTGSSALMAAAPYAGGALLMADAANRVAHDKNKTSAAVGAGVGAVVGGILGGPLGAGVGAEVGAAVSKPISNIGSGIADIFGWAEGGSFTVDKPSMFMAGERGLEDVLITPRNANHNNRGGGSVNLNIHGPVVMDDISMSKLAKMLAREQARWK